MTYVFGKIGKGKVWHIFEQQGDVYYPAHYSFNSPACLTGHHFPVPDALSPTFTPSPLCKTCILWFRFNRPDDYRQIFGENK